METRTTQNRIEDLTAQIVSDSLRTVRLRRLIFSVADNLVDGWAQGKPLRQHLARPLRWALARGTAQNGKTAPGTFSADLGKLLTSWSAGVSADHEKDPLSHVQARVETIGAFMQNTDFGEICEMVQGSEECVVRTVDAFNQQLWKYPAKVGSILATVLAAANTSIRALRELMRPVEKTVGPDLLADLILSLLKGINAQSAGELSNSALELLRRLHTGSLLLGRTGRPLFQVYLTDFLKSFAQQIDSTLLGKARIALAEDRESIDSALADALEENPDLMLALVSTLGAMKNASVKSSARRLKALNNIDQDILSRAIGQAGTDLDTFEAAELVNTFFHILNRLHDANPDLFSSIVRSTTDSLDPQEIRQTLEWLVPEVLDAFQPVLMEAIPLLIRGLCDMISPDSGFGSREQEEAVSRLKTVLRTAEGER